LCETISDRKPSQQKSTKTSNSSDSQHREKGGLRQTRGRTHHWHAAAWPAVGDPENATHARFRRAGDGLHPSSTTVFLSDPGARVNSPPLVCAMATTQQVFFPPYGTWQAAGHIVGSVDGRSSRYDQVNSSDDRHHHRAHTDQRSRHATYTPDGPPRPLLSTSADVVVVVERMPSVDERMGGTGEYPGLSCPHNVISPCEA
jgi:hypothetical protein